MKIIVTGLECSGTKWVTALLSRHPDVTECVHTSIPENPGSSTQYPNLGGADAVVCVVRYEPLRDKSVKAAGYREGRHQEFRPPELLLKAVELVDTQFPHAELVSYEILVGPFGYLHFRELLRRLGLAEFKFPRHLFNPIDGNAKYL